MSIVNLETIKVLKKPSTVRAIIKHRQLRQMARLIAKLFVEILSSEHLNPVIAARPLPLGPSNAYGRKSLIQQICSVSW